jgi:hypothetical protein
LRFVAFKKRKNLSLLNCELRYFKNCIGAIDGTHIPASVKEIYSSRFRNRKGFLSQNVLAASSFDMCFQYVLAGWEGSAHDAKVLQDAMTKGLPVLEGKYYLGDAGYANSSYCLTPSRGTLILSQYRSFFLV